MIRKTFLKKALGVMTTMVITMTMIAGCSETSKGDSASGNTIKLGGVFPLTGDVPALGAAMDNGAKLAIKEINAAGGVLGKQLELTVEDDQNQAATAPNAKTDANALESTTNPTTTVSTATIPTTAAVSTATISPTTTTTSTHALFECD